MKIFFALFLLCPALMSCVEDQKTVPNQVHTPAESQSFDSSIIETKFFPNLNLTQLIMANKMTVWLKPTDFETNEVLIKLSALGGFAALDPDKRPSGRLAAQISWESGLGRFTSDQLSSFLYRHSLELVTKIEPFSRTIEGSASCQEDLREFFQCVNMIFTQSKWTESGLKAAIENSKRALSKIDYDYEQVYENAFLQINTQGLEYLSRLTPSELKDVDLYKAKSFFEICTADPSAFVCVIVGNFKLEAVKRLVGEFLGTIPKKGETDLFERQYHVAFPPGITQKNIDLPGRPGSLTRLTFPLQPVLNEKNIPSMEFMCQIIEARLRLVITKRMKLSHGVDVSYEFPLFPLLSAPWISVHFRSDPQQVNLLKEMILYELRELQEHGVTEKEMLEIKRLETGSEEFWFRDNFYWVSMLTNYYLWKWNPEQIHKAEVDTQNLTLEAVNHMLKTYFVLSNYTCIVGTSGNK